MSIDKMNGCMTWLLVLMTAIYAGMIYGKLEKIEAMLEKLIDL